MEYSIRLDAKIWRDIILMISHRANRRENAMTRAQQRSYNAHENPQRINDIRENYNCIIFVKSCLVACQRRWRAYELEKKCLDVCCAALRSLRLEFIRSQWTFNAKKAHLRVALSVSAVSWGFSFAVFCWLSYFRFPGAWIASIYNSRWSFYDTLLK